jgi:gliding motility-associated-like protein
MSIEVEIPSTLIIPNIFSPNGDGANDLFFVKATNLDKIDILIIDRWGNKVYELSSSTGNIAWDGKNQYGKEVASGVYLYKLKASGKDGTSYDKQGTITLVR